MIRQSTVWFVVALVVAGTGGAAWLWQQHGSPLARHRSVVRGFLSDPGSAVFRSERPSEIGVGVWCGEVNARNRNGGMSGFTRYVLLLKEGSTDPQARDAVLLDRYGGPDGIADAPPVGQFSFGSMWAVQCE